MATLVVISAMLPANRRYAIAAIDDTLTHYHYASQKIADYDDRSPGWPLLRQTWRLAITIA